jgi:hypothetical protein
MKAKYCIRVRGIVDKSWSDYFGALTITIQDEEGQPQITTLCGEVADQSALVGILYRLYGLGFELLSLEKVLPVLTMLIGAALICTAFGMGAVWSPVSIQA